MWVWPTSHWENWGKNISKPPVIKKVYSDVPAELHPKQRLVIN